MTTRYLKLIYSNCHCQTPDCKACPVPMEIDCIDVQGATGTVMGECRMTRSKTYYLCDQGDDCKDQAIITKCTKGTFK